MAATCRIKLVLEEVQPCWMLVDTENAPKIADVQRHIQRKFAGIAIARLELEGCELPADESSLLLRDNDAVHVIVEGNTCKSNYSTVLSSILQQKRKHSDDREHVTNGDHCMTDSKEESGETENRKNKKKHKPKFEADLDCNAEDVASAGDSHVWHVPCDGEPKKKKKKHKKESQSEDESKSKSSKMEVSSMIEPLLEQVKAKKLALKHLAESHCTESAAGNAKEGKLSTLAEGDLAKQDLNVNASTSDADLSKNGKRRRRHRKRKISSSNKSSKPETPVVTAVAPVTNLRLPRVKQPQGKKTTFASDHEESDETETAMDVENECSLPESYQPKKSSKKRNKRAVSDTGSSLSEAYPTESTPIAVRHAAKNSKGSASGITKFFSKFLQGKAEVSEIQTTPNSKFQADSKEVTVDMTEEIAEQDGGDGVNQDQDGVEADGWYDSQQYNDKQTNKRYQKQTIASVNRSTLGHLVTGWESQPDLAEYLKMGPQERGASLPPNVTATRMLNGAILYSRASTVTTQNLVDSSPSSTSTPRGFGSPFVVYSSSSSQAFGSPAVRRRVDDHKSSALSKPSHSAKKNSGSSAGTSNMKTQSSADQNKANLDSDIISHAATARDYSLFPNLTDSPVVGDRIAYKVLEMGADYTPGISDYKEALVLEYDAGSQSVTVKLFHQAESQKRKPGRFDLPEEEDETEETVMLELSSMFEPKLLERSPS